MLPKSKITPYPREAYKGIVNHSLINLRSVKNPKFNPNLGTVVEHGSEGGGNVSEESQGILDESGNQILDESGRSIF